MPRANGSTASQRRKNEVHGLLLEVTLAELNIPQAQADALIALEKHRADNSEYVFPDQGIVTIPLVSADRREMFALDIRNGRIDLCKATYQNRARHVLILVRLDLGERPHRNPDGQSISSPHLHIYREGFGDRWAFPLPKDAFAAPDDKWQSLQDFMRYCNITKLPKIQRGLFI